jgi:hypothetical protein
MTRWGFACTSVTVSAQVQHPSDSGAWRGLLGPLPDLEVADLPQRPDLLRLSQSVPVLLRRPLPLRTTLLPLRWKRRQSTRDEWRTFRHFGLSTTAWLSCVAWWWAGDVRLVGEGAAGGGMTRGLAGRVVPWFGSVSRRRRTLGAVVTSSKPDIARHSSVRRRPPRARRRSRHDRSWGGHPQTPARGRGVEPAGGAAGRDRGRGECRWLRGSWSPGWASWTAK